MTAEIIDGEKIAIDLEKAVAAEIAALPAGKVGGSLVTLSVGDQFSSVLYERRLERTADRCGVPYRHSQLPHDSTEAEVVAEIGRLNLDPDVAGIVVLRPLPAGASESSIFASIAPKKDIDAVHPENVGLLAWGEPRFVPPTAASAFHVLDTWLDQTGQDGSGFYENAHIVVVGRSNNVGKPAVLLGHQRLAAVTSIDNWSARGSCLGFHTRRADVLIVATGVRGLIGAEHVQEGAVVLDVGTSPEVDQTTGEVHMFGDVVLSEVVSRARAVTPVPGGIGPVTDLWLLRNVVLAESERTGGIQSGRGQAQPLASSTHRVN